MKRTFVIRSREDLQKFWRYSQQWTLDKPVQLVVSLYKKRRSTSQNAKMWAMLGEISEQVEWHGHRLTPENYKDLFTACLKRQKSVPGIDGGFVVLGTSTRDMTTMEMSDLIELMYSFAAEHGVQWRDEEAA